MREQPERRIVVVYDVDNIPTDKIVDMLIDPCDKKIKFAPVSVIGFADAAQVRQIVGIINGKYDLPQ